jgi:hypothetical protein
MHRRSLSRGWPLLVALAAGCSNDSTTPGNSGGSGGAGATGTGGTAGTGGTSGVGGSGGSTPKDGGVADTGTPMRDGASDGNSDGAIPPGDGGLRPCPLDLPGVLDRPPSGALPCDLLPPNFVSP